MRRLRRSCITKIIAAAVIVVVAGSLLWVMLPFVSTQGVTNPTKQPSLDGNAQFDPNTVEWFTVQRVVDGDTIVIDSGASVRYIGVDTPELEEKECFATEAAQQNRTLVAARQVGLRKDVSETDRYGRLLRYVYLPNGTMVNAKLVQGGYASVATFPPDLLFVDHFRQLEEQARTAGRGLWGKCKS